MSSVKSFEIEVQAKFKMSSKRKKTPLIYSRIVTAKKDKNSSEINKKIKSGKLFQMARSMS